MSKKILIACYEVPGHGGASTSSYNLFRMLQHDGLQVHYMNIIRPEHQPYYKYVFGDDYGNPAKLDNVYNCILDDKKSYGKADANITELVGSLDPEIIIGVHYLAVFLIKEAFDKIPLIYYASGCMQMQELLRQHKESSFLSFFNNIEKENNAHINSPEILNYQEKVAVEKADLILTHSEMVRSLYNYFYPFNGKIYDDAIWKFEWIYNDAHEHKHLAKPFNEREIEVLFVSTDWNRVEKNKSMLLDILSNLENYNVSVVGEIEKSYGHVNYANIVSDRNKLFKIMGNSKSVISVSSYDPAPGILYEASAMGCNIVASKNCGNWQICNEQLLVDDYTKQGFLDNINLCTKRKLKDNKDFFIRSESYKKLFDILDLF